MRLSLRHSPIDWPDLVKIIQQDLGRPMFVAVADTIAQNDILGHLLKMKNIELTDSKNATPWQAYAITPHQFFDNMSAEKAVEQMSVKRNKALLRIGTIIEAAFLRVAGSRPVVKDWKFIVRRGEWLVERLVREVSPGLVESEMTAWFGFRKLTKAEIEARDAGRVP